MSTFVNIYILNFNFFQHLYILNFKFYEAVPPLYMKKYLYDDKISFIFNSGDTPITIDDKLLSDIEADNKAFECSFLEQSAPPKKKKNL